MLLTLTTTHVPATDLGYLLHKHPDGVHIAEQSFGRTILFYPEASETRTTAALMLEIDPISLVRGRSSGEAGLLDQYVNDRPYVSSSFLSVALSKVFGSALNGRSKDRPELAQTAIPLEATLAALPCRGGEALLRRLFEPLGYAVTATQEPLDPTVPSWGESRYFTVQLRATVVLATLLNHLYVLIPVLDDEKHYYVGADEVEKLVRRGEGWLPTHPERDLILKRALKHRLNLTRDALARLTPEEPDADAVEVRHDEAEAAVEAPLSLHEQRLGTVAAALKASGATRVLDLGCGEGKLIRRLLAEPQFREIVGMDVSIRLLETAASRLKLDRLPPMQATRVRLLQSALTYRDERLIGFDAAALVEVIEHLDPARLEAFEAVLFGETRPGTVVITTPNVEYNVRFPTLPAGRFRHRDHRFEWTRPMFQSWADGVASRHGYTVRTLPIGPLDPEVGAPTQMAIFELQAASSAASSLA